MKIIIPLLLPLALVLFCKKPEAPASAPAAAESQVKQEEKIPPEFFEQNLDVIAKTVMRQEPSETAPISCCKTDIDDTTIDPNCPEGQSSIVPAGTKFFSNGRSEEKIKGKNGEFYWYRMHTEGAQTHCPSMSAWISGETVKYE